MRIRLAALLITVLALSAGATIARAAGGQSAAGTPSLSSRPPVALPSVTSGAGTTRSAAPRSARAASGAALPRTGLDVVLISLSGVALLALGSSLRLAVGGRP